MVVKTKKVSKKVKVTFFAKPKKKDLQRIKFKSLEKEFDDIYDKEAIKKLPNWRRCVVRNFKNKKITKAQHDDLITQYDNWRLCYIEGAIYPRRTKRRGVLKR